MKQNYKVVQQSKEKVFKKTLKILMYCFCVILVKFVSTTRLRRLYVYLYGDEFPLKSLFQMKTKLNPKCIYFTPPIGSKQVMGEMSELQRYLMVF